MQRTSAVQIWHEYGGRLTHMPSWRGRSIDAPRPCKIGMGTRGSVVIQQRPHWTATVRKDCCVHGWLASVAWGTTTGFPPPVRRQQLHENEHQQR